MQEINNKAKKSFIGATVTEIKDNIMYFSNGQGIVLTEEEINVINNNFKTDQMVKRLKFANWKS